MIEEATVDAHGELEQAVGWHTVLSYRVSLPFETTVLGVSVKVTRIDLSGDTRIVAICRRGRERQTIDLLDLPLPSPLPDGAEWIEAYRHWAGKP